MRRSAKRAGANDLRRNAIESRFSAALIALAAIGCRSVESKPDTTPPSTDASTDPAKNVAQLERQVHLATTRAEIARTQEHEQGAVNAIAAAHLEAEIKDLEDQLAQLEHVDAPARVAKAKLELSQMQDALAEQQEELAQLEMMYKESDLADKTREIVLNRGKRRVERAQEKLELQAHDVKTLGETTLPHEHDKLARQLELKRRELERAQRQAEILAQEKRVASESADLDVMRAESDLAAAKRSVAK